MTPLSTLLAMHTFCRPMGGSTEQRFREQYLLTLPGATVDPYGNIHVETDSTSTTLWSAHTDTVHKHDGMQTTHLDANGMLHLSKRSRHTSSCLGADDTVGCFLMREMILAGVPGYYIFHHGEERGGIGSSALARQQPEFLKRFSRAIALDRGGYTDVIISQWSQDTCSETFARTLGTLLGPSYAPHAGVYTDTYEYAHLIPECSNLSVGYFHAHTAAECVDTRHVLWLLSRLTTCDFSTLPTVRDPTVRPMSFDFSPYIVSSRSSSFTWTEQDDIREDFDACDDEALTALLDDAEQAEDWPLARLIEDETYARMAALDLADRHHTAREDCYLDPDFADIQRLLFHQKEKAS